METVTVAAARGSGFGLSGTTWMIVSLLVAGAVAYAVMVSLKHFRSRAERSTRSAPV